MVDKAMMKKVVSIYRRLPNIQLGEVMKLAGFGDDEINKTTRRIIQRALPGGSLKAFRASIAANSTPAPSRLMRYENRTGVDIAMLVMVHHHLPLQRWNQPREGRNV